MLRLKQGARLGVSFQFAIALLIYVVGIIVATALIG